MASLTCCVGRGVLPSLSPLASSSSSIFSLRAPSTLYGSRSSNSIIGGGSGRRRRVQNLTVFAGRGEGGGADAADRVVAASGYLLPFLDGIQYGRYFFTQFPAAQVAFQPLYPLLRIYSSTPFASVAVFFGLYFLVVRNPNFSRYVRFNTMQAVVLDVLLILPNLVEGLFHPKEGVGFEVLVIFYNTVFLYLVACFLIGSGSCILGRTPRLPLVADAADAQVM